MSLKLDCGTNPEAMVVTLPNRSELGITFPVTVGISLSNVDMANLVRYWLTNTDLAHEDARVDLLSWIATLHIGPGFNPDGRRLVEDQPGG